MKTEKIITDIQNNGYSVVKDFFSINQKQLDTCDNLLKNNLFERGAVYRTNNINLVPGELLSLVCNEDIKHVFAKFAKDIMCQEVFITHEYKTNILTRPNQLHFDRLRSLKIMVYVSDVDENSGPLSVVPGSHKTSRVIRRQFSKMEYEHRNNIIKQHYPHLYEEPVKICGNKGTMIFFDSDVFHLGGKNEENYERKIIRSHWFPNQQWRVTS